MYGLTTDLTMVGVIPVLMNTGAALLPAAIAAMASAVALLFKPKELFRVCKAKPHVPVILLAAAAGLFFGVPWLMSLGGEAPAPVARQAAAQAGGGAASQTDWPSVALQIIRNEQRSARGGGVQEDPGQTDGGTNTPVVEKDLGYIFRRDAARRGHDGGPSPLNLSLDWESHPEEFAMILTAPLEKDGIVYAASTLLDPPSTFGMVFAVDSDTGEIRWKAQQLDASGRQMKGFFSSPALTPDGRYLIIGQGLHPDTACELICLDTETGAVVWTVLTPLHIESSPAIYGDIVVVGAGAIEVGPERKPAGDPAGVGNPGYVFAVRISTGEELWRYPVNDPESSPAIQNGIAYIGSGFNGQAVVALRVEGTDAELKAQGLERLVWSRETPYAAVAAVTLVDDLVLIGGGNSDFVFADPNPAGVILALDQKTGDLRWSLDMPDSVLGPIAVHNGIGVAPVRSAPHQGRRSGMLVAFDVRDKGRVLWNHHLDRTALMLAGAALTDTHVYAVSSDGYLRVLNAKDGSLVEEHYVNRADRPGEMGLSISSPTISGGRLYLGTETGGLRAYEGRVNP